MGREILDRPTARCEEFRLPALAFEREASDRYHDFAEWFAEHGLTGLGALCTRLRALHVEDGMRIAGAGGKLADGQVDALRQPWIREARGDGPEDELFYGLATARLLIQVALAEETLAARSFDAAAHALSDEGGRKLAAALGASSRRCADELAGAMEAASPPDWEAIIADGGGPCLALGAERRLHRT